MKIIHPPHRRAFAALVPATLLLAAPALAQEAAAPPAEAQVAPPPVVRTLPQASAPTTNSPSPMTNGVSARNGIGDPNSTTPIAPEAIAQAEEGRAARATTTRTATRPSQARATPARQPAAPTRPAATPAPEAAAPAPVAATPVTAPPASAAAAPVAMAPEAAPVAAPTETTAPVQTATTDTAATDATTTTGAPVWPWIVGGLIVLAGLLAFFLRRRNRVDEYDEVYEEPVYEEPVVQTVAEPAVIKPVAAAPLAEQRQTQGTRLEPQFLRTAPITATAAVIGTAAEQADAVAVDAELAAPEAEDVAALTAATGHADRPWLEFAMRPVRAGSNADDAMVEIELTVANSGAVEAQDVRISTFMFADGSATAGEMERLLTAHAANSEVAPVTIPAGEGTRVDALLSLPKEHLGDETQAFNPVIVADARYRLADGSEGRTSASFTIGRAAEAGDDMGGIAIHRQQMSDDIEARLHGTPAHA